MVERALADVVLILHLLFILFVVLGALLTLRWRWMPILHLPAALWGVYIEMSRGVCPLTPLENKLRSAAGASGYEGGFVEHYLVPLIYPSELTYPIQLILAGLVVLANTSAYYLVWHRSHSSRE